jgi:putative DNA primase/helicase
LNLQKIMILLGVAGTGKGVTERVIEAVIGDGCKAITLSQLGLPHGISPLVGASVIKLSDVRHEGRSSWSSGSEALGLLLAISGGDPVPVNPKHRPLYSGRLTQCVIMVSNKLPGYLVDGAGALGRRVETVTFGLPRNIRRVADPALVEQILAEELSGIVGRALDGLDRLQRTGKFSSSNGIRDQQRFVTELLEPLRSFAQYLAVASGQYLTRRELYNGYVRWTRSEGRHPLNQQGFASDLRTALFAVHEFRLPTTRVQRRVAGEVQDVWLDLAWREDTPDDIRRDTSRIRAALDDLDEALE